MTQPKYTPTTNVDKLMGYQRLAETLNRYAPCFSGVEDVKRVGLTKYFDGSPGLVAEITWDDGTVEETTLSVNLAESGRVAPEGHVYIADYSEHEGKTLALEEAGIATKVKREQIGFGNGWLVKVCTDKVEVLR